MHNQNSKISPLSWAVWLIVSLFYAYQYILRVMPSIMMENIMNSFEMNATAFGQFSGIYYVGYSLVHLPMGILLDRFGAKKIITLSILISVIGTIPLLLSNYWLWPILGRLLTGIGSSAAILGVFKIIRVVFSENLFPKMLSISVTIGLLGAIYGGGPINYLQDILGYDAVLKIVITTGLALACITYLILPPEKRSTQASVASDVYGVLSNKKVLFTCLFAGMMVGPLEGFADVWAAKFLEQVYGLKEQLASSMPSLIFIGMCFGAPLLTMLADKAGNYMLTICASGLVMCLCFTLMLFYNLSSTLTSFNFIILGICSSYQILAIYKASKFVQPEVAGITTALANMIIMIFGYLFHTVIGLVVSAMGGPENQTALIMGLMVIPLFLTLGSVGFLTLNFTTKKIYSKITN